MDTSQSMKQRWPVAERKNKSRPNLMTYQNIVEHRKQLPQSLDDRLYEMHKKCWQGGRMIKDSVESYYRATLELHSLKYDVHAHLPIARLYIQRIYRRREHEKA